MRTHALEGSGVGEERKGTHCRNVNFKPSSVGDQRHLDNRHVVHVGGNGVHPVRRRAHEDLLLCGSGGDAHDEVDDFV